jgi:hypothetical protein
MLRVVRPEDKDSVSLFAATLFSAHEPMTKALSIPAEDVAHLYSPIIEACCSSGLSFMLEQEGSIVCLSLALPYTQYEAVQWPEVPSARPVAAIMNSLPPLPAGQDPTNTVYMFLWGTGSTHMGKGYIRTAVEASMQATRRSGYSCLVADATNVVSQHLAMSHFGFQPLEPRACYHDHESLKGVQGTEYVIRAVKYLAAEPAAEPAAATAYA